MLRGCHLVCLRGPAVLVLEGPSLESGGPGFDPGSSLPGWWTYPSLRLSFPPVEGG